MKSHTTIVQCERNATISRKSFFFAPVKCTVDLAGSGVVQGAYYRYLASKPARLIAHSTGTESIDNFFVSPPLTLQRRKVDVALIDMSHRLHFRRFAHCNTERAMLHFLYTRKRTSFEHRCDKIAVAQRWRHTDQNPRMETYVHTYR